MSDGGDAMPELAELEARKKMSERELNEAMQMLQIVRDPSVDWNDKKKTVDSVIEKRAAAGRELERLEKQGQELAAAILAKQQTLVRIGREAMELSLCRGEIDEMIELTRKAIATNNNSMQQVHFGGSM